MCHIGAFVGYTEKYFIFINTAMFYNVISGVRFVEIKYNFIVGKKSYGFYCFSANPISWIYTKNEKAFGCL